MPQTQHRTQNQRPLVAAAGRRHSRLLEIIVFQGASLAGKVTRASVGECRRVCATMDHWSSQVPLNTPSCSVWQ